MKKLLLEYKYINPEEATRIRQFKYQGGSVSILYEYLWSPLCQFLVEKLPKTIAPNTITIIAFFQHFIVHLLMVYYSPDLKQQVPGALLFIQGLSTLAYQILDNMDGKQARRTGASSPLGMLFDHFLDSCNSWVLGLNFLICMGTGYSRIVLFATLINCYIVFFIAMLSQYYKGVLILARVNGVDEGLPVLWGLHIFTAFVGVNFWQQQAFSGISVGEVLALVLILVGIKEVVQFLHMIFNDVCYIQLTKEEEKHIFSLAHKIKSLVPCVLLFLVFASFALAGNDEYFYQNYCYYVFVVIMGMLFSKVTLHVQIAHLSNDIGFKQMRYSFVLVSFIIIINNVSRLFLGENFWSFGTTMILLFIYSFITFWHTCVNVVIQLSQILKIQVFSLKYLEQQDKKN
ncbi:hypothetical protein PPERSA_06389 [Pseudocohnilembus persalinus]|uniref:CDP-alcohol phosphatidyltransferase n=1 Tax=Pseudocohnilembus persalinus TaxID=266149 RepID=A0A0V0QIY1_PSEPJ|nr:hypothetical protein PPERSA_06389 [Pseudocohnilembus persalinus]|eukprot:KRX02194.1 hypothetical protein PPERSA_06389 [Pseudocohnilembus persalinus]